MDQGLVHTLATQAYYALIRALQAGGKLNFDTEELVQTVQTVLQLPDETVEALLERVEQDEEANQLKGYDASIVKPQAAVAAAPMTAVAAAPMAMMQAAVPMQQPMRTNSMARPAAPMQPVMAAAGYPESPYGQAPAAKKQKKAAAPTASMPRQGATPGSGSKAGGGTTSKSKAKSVPTTPVGAAIPVAGGAGFKTQPTKLPSAAPLAINPARYMQVMESNNEQEMAVYLQELNKREREIFEELIKLGVTESDPQLDDVHRALLQWYRLDMRQMAMEAEMQMV